MLLSTLFSNTLNLCSSISVRDQVSHPYKTTGRIIVLYILIFKEKIKTHILGSIIFFPKNRAVYEIMLKNIVELDRPHMALGRKRFPCLEPKATDRYLEYVIFSTSTAVTRCYVIRKLPVFLILQASWLSSTDLHKCRQYQILRESV